MLKPECYGQLPGPGSWQYGVVSTDIVDETGSPPTSVLQAGFRDAVGQEESLQAVVLPTDAAPYLSNPTWSIPYNTFDASSAYVNGYSQTKELGTVDSSVNLNSLTLHFFPIAAYPRATGNLTFSGDADSAGTAFNASTTYEIDAPTISLTTIPGHVQLGSIITNSTPVIVAGPTYENGGSSGIEYRATFTSPDTFVFGVVGMTQLASIYLIFNGAPNGNTQLSSLYTTAFDLDGTDPAYGQLVNGVQGTPEPELGQNGTADFETTDEPHMPLSSCTDFDEIFDAFQDYFYFKPTAKTNWTSIPVTLATENWEFQAYGQKSDSASTNTVLDWSLGVWEDVNPSGESASSLLPTWPNFVDDDKNGGLPC